MPLLSIVTALMLTAPLAAQSPPTASGLKIVVIEGEAGVNIIQQKTAVKPVIEVRDRNNLPVPGAIVTFSIEGGTAASFGGASTLTVATNAAGQAAVTGMTPATAGAFQIQVSAAFQGQVASATIAQTNVMTAAQAVLADKTLGQKGVFGVEPVVDGAMDDEAVAAVREIDEALVEQRDFLFSRGGKNRTEELLAVGHTLELGTKARGFGEQVGMAEIV